MLKSRSMLLAEGGGEGAVSRRRGSRLFPGSLISVVYRVAGGTRSKPNKNNRQEDLKRLWMPRFCLIEKV